MPIMLKGAWCRETHNGGRVVSSGTSQTEDVMQNKSYTFLFFQVGEYVSILIDNGTGSALTILRDSLFSGILIGV